MVEMERFSPTEIGEAEEFIEQLILAEEKNLVENELGATRASVKLGDSWVYAERVNDGRFQIEVIVEGVSQIPNDQPSSIIPEKSREFIGTIWDLCENSEIFQYPSDGLVEPWRVSSGNAEFRTRVFAKSYDKR